MLAWGGLWLRLQVFKAVSPGLSRGFGDFKKSEDISTEKQQNEYIAYSPHFRTNPPSPAALSG